MAFSAHKDPESVKEHFAQDAIIEEQSVKVAQLIKDADYFVAFTGAGISTSAGIPDFRGPQGVWTLRAQGKRPVSRHSTLQAVPTPTHMSLVALEQKGYLKFLISQNTDGLHRRSGFPPTKLAELHGNTNLEVCKNCKKEYMRDFHCREAYDVHDHKTTRKCVCGGVLYDSIINFHENLPEKGLNDGFAHSKRADLCLALGSSLTVTPAGDMPRETLDNDGDLVVCNLQKTEFDDDCTVRVFSKTDTLMEKVMKHLKLEIPEWLLRRYLTVTFSKLASNRVCISVTGTDSDGTPASIFKKIKIKSSADHYKSLEKEPFVMDYPLETGTISKFRIKLYFMGHYNEPELRLKEKFDHQQTSKRVKFILSYNPRSRQWTVDRSE